MLGEELIKMRVVEFNGLPAESHEQRIKLLRGLLDLAAIKKALIYGRTCYWPSRQKIKVSIRGGQPRFLAVMTSGANKRKQGFVAILESMDGNTILHEALPLADISLRVQPLLKGLEDNNLLLIVDCAGLSATH